RVSSVCSSTWPYRNSSTRSGRVTQATWPARGMTPAPATGPGRAGWWRGRGRSAGTAGGPALLQRLVRADMSATLAVGKQSAIPGDDLRYTARVANTGATLTLRGSYPAAEGTDSDGTIVAWYGEVEYRTRPAPTSTG